MAFELLCASEKQNIHCQVQFVQHRDDVLGQNEWWGELSAVEKVWNLITAARHWRF